MSLQVWLPLNGNLNNQGLSNVTVTNNGATVNNNGKIGKCYYFNGTNAWIQISLPSHMTSLKNTSIAMWGKGNRSFGGISQNIGTIACCTCYGGWQFTDGSTWRYWSCGNYTDGNWHHVCCTIDDDILTTYCDGVKISSASLSANKILTDLTSSNFLEIGCDHPGGDEYGNIYVNDFRVYDHCLSAKEVKEISKGLVLHYKLDNNGFGLRNLAINTQKFFNVTPYNVNTVSGAGQIEFIPLSRTDNVPCGYCIGYKYTPSANYGQGGIYFLARHTLEQLSVLELNKTYTLSFYAKSLSGKASCNTAQICESQTLLSYTGTSSNGRLIFNNYWSKYSVTFKYITTSKFTCCWYINNTFSDEVYLSSFKLEEGIVATQWCPNENDDLYGILGLDKKVEYDTSGFSNNGTPVITLKQNYLAEGGALSSFNGGSVTWESSEKRYKIVSPVTDYTWGAGCNIKEGTITVPYGQHYRISFEAYVPTAHKLQIDYNNTMVGVTNWSGNDNDLGTSRLPGALNLPANTWTRVVIGTKNGHASNTTSVAMKPYDAFGLITKDDTESVTWYIRNLKVELGGFETPYSSDGILLGYDNTRKLSYNMNKVGSIKHSNPFKTNITEVTYSFWIKPISNAGNYQIIYAPHEEPTGAIWLAFNTEGHGLWAYHGGNSPYYHKSGINILSLNTWYHVAFVFKNGISSWFLNGVKVGDDVTWTNKYITYKEFQTIGNGYSGYSWNTQNNSYISDFRIYATALSVADIKELYNSPISITKNGTLMIQGEVIEQ